MQKARALLYVSLSILALSVAFHLGARTAHGQSTTSDAVVWVSHDLAYTQRGNVYVDKYGNGTLWEWRGNVFAGDPNRARGARPTP